VSAPSLVSTDQKTVNTTAVHTVPAISTLLEVALEEGALAGGVLLASRGGMPLVSLAFGSKLPRGEDGAESIRGDMTVDTVFDLGGLTESICTATVLMRLVSAGKIAVHDRASRFLQALGVGQKSSMTLAHLLSHRAGFPTGISVYDDLVKANAGPRPGILASSGAKQYAYTHFHNLPLKFEPGARELRADANYIVLGEICEIITGLPLDKAYARYVAAPLKTGSLNFIDLTLVRRRGLEPVVEIFAPSGRCSRRGRVLAGEVWDENAWVMGGVSGHSGLFGTAGDVHTWACEIVRGYRGESSLLSSESVRSFVDPECKLGCVSTNREHGFVDSTLAPRAFVSVGNTGCSVFIEPERQFVSVFLTNAGFSGHISRRFLTLRADLHAALLEA